MLQFNKSNLDQLTDLDPFICCSLLRLSVDDKKHQADDDERLDERRKEEDDPHVVAAALRFGLVQVPYPWAQFGPRVAGAVHD